MVLDWLPCCSKQEKYVVRWHFSTVRPGFIRLKRGDEVYILDYAYNDLFGQQIPVVQNVRSRGQRGYISPHFIIKKSELKRPREPIERGLWYVGDIGAVEAGMILKGNKFMAGSFIVCSPPEYFKFGNWPNLLLLIRIYSESEEKCYDWFNRKRFEQLLPPKDRIPGPLAPLPIIAYVRIRRNSKTGGYYIYAGEKRNYNTLNELIIGLVGQAIYADMDVKPIPRSTISKDIKKRKQLYEVEVPAPPCIPGKVSLNYPSAASENPLMLLPKGAKYKVEFSRKTTKGLFGVVAIGELEYQRKFYAVIVQSIIDSNGIYAKEFQRLQAENLRSAGNYLVRFFAMKLLEDGTTHIITERMHLGPVNEFLRDRCLIGKELPYRGLLEILYQVACGMKYIQENNLKHRQLNGTNVLVERESRNSIMIKISDYFIYTAVLEDKGYINEMGLENLCWRSMALESLKKLKFSLTSDVWSFGILIFEILTHGSIPYCDIKHPNELIEFLENGKRLTRAECIPPYIYHVSIQCWEQNIKKRPTFDDLFYFLDDLLFDSVSGPNGAILRMEDGTTGTGSYGSRGRYKNQGSSAKPSEEQRRTALTRS